MLAGYAYDSRCKRQKDIVMTERILLDFVLGDFVRHPQKPEWGIGQIQSVDRARVTVTFEHGGKQLIKAALVQLQPVGERTE